MKTNPSVYNWVKVVEILIVKGMPLPSIFFIHLLSGKIWERGIANFIIALRYDKGNISGPRNNVVWYACYFFKKSFTAFRH